MNENYYKIMLSYEIPYNVLDSQDPDIIKAKNTLYEHLRDNIPPKYDRFSVKLVLHQVKETYNYLLTYDAFFRGICRGSGFERLDKKRNRGIL